MKKIKMITTSAIISLIFLLIGCQNSNIVENQLEKKTLKGLGKFHNETITEYYNSRNGLEFTEENKITLDSFNELLDFVAEVGIEHGLGEQEVQEAKEYFINTMEDLGMFTKVNEETFFEPLDKEKLIYTYNYYKDNQLISSQTESNLNTLIESFIQNESLEQIDIKVSVLKEILPSINDEKSKFELSNFVEVYDASKELWTSRNRAPGTGTIIADGVGGLVGSLLPPAGSFIWGTLYSVIWNEYEQDQRSR